MRVVKLKFMQNKKPSSKA